MTLGFRIAPSVWTVLAEAQAWYEEQRSGLGTEFMAAVEGGLDDIRRAPEQWPIWRFDRPYRKRVLGRFPYVIFYVVEPVLLARQPCPGLRLRRTTILEARAVALL